MRDGGKYLEDANAGDGCVGGPGVCLGAWVIG